jgi:hypothetical protein
MLWTLGFQIFLAVIFCVLFFVLKFSSDISLNDKDTRFSHIYIFFPTKQPPRVPRYTNGFEFVKIFEFEVSSPHFKKNRERRWPLTHKYVEVLTGKPIKTLEALWSMFKTLEVMIARVQNVPTELP